MNPIHEIEQNLIALRDVPGQLFNLSQYVTELKALENLIWFEAGLVLEKIQLFVDSDKSVGFEAQTSILNNSVSAAISVSISYDGNGLQTNMGLSFNNNIDLKALIDNFANNIFPAELIRLLDGIGIRNVSWIYDPKKEISAKCQLTGDIKLDFGIIKMQLNLEKLYIKIDPKTDSVSGVISVLVIIGDTMFPAELILGEKFEVRGFPELSLELLSDLFKIELPPIPDILPIKLPSFGDIEIALINSIAQFSYDFNAFGRARGRFKVLRHQNEWVLITGINAPTNFKFSDIERSLEPLDFIMKSIKFDAPALSLSTKTLQNIDWEDINGVQSRVAFPSGFNINAELDLESVGLGILKEITGLDAFPVIVPLDEALNNLRISTCIPDKIELLPNAVTLQGLCISIAARPFSLTASSVATVNIFGEQLPPFDLNVGITEGMFELALTSNEPWQKPLGLPFNIINLGFSIAIPGPAFGFTGTIQIQDKALLLATQFIGNAPTYLIGRLDGELALNAIIQDLTNFEILPEFLQMILRDFKLRVVTNPLGVTVGGVLYPFGLSFEGVLSFLGLSLKTMVVIDPNAGVRAKGSLDKPIIIAPLLEIRGANGQATPSITLDTNIDPILSMSANVTLLGIENQLVAYVRDNGFTFDFENSFGPVNAKLSSTLADGTLNATGTINCRIEGKIGPIRILGVGPNLGTIRLSTGFDANVEMQIASGENQSLLKVNGRFFFNGATINLPQFSITLLVESIEKLPEVILKEIIKRAEELFADLLADFEKWLRAIGDKLIEEIDNIAETLKEHFNRTADDIAKAYKDVLNKVAMETAKALKDIGETAETITRALLNAGETVEDVADALKGIGEAPEEIARFIGNALADLGMGIEDIAKELEKIVGLPGKIIEDIIGDIKIPKLPFIKLPFVKLPFVKLPFVKLPFVKLPHVKIRF